MAREGGVRELYAGFIPLLCKQIPYAIGQFATNEYMHEVVYRNMTNATKENLSTSEQTGITLGGGIIAAGFFSLFLECYPVLSEPLTLYWDYSRSIGILSGDSV